MCENPRCTPENHPDCDYVGKTLIDGYCNQYCWRDDLQRLQDLGEL